jgi:glycosyltransferase involved in cell wall biosynthesis
MLMRHRVVIFSAFISPMRSGAEAMVEEVAQRLSHDFDITIIAAKMRRGLPRDEINAQGLHVVRLGFGFWIDKWLYPFLAPLAARRYAPVLIHAVLETFAGLALVISRLTSPHAKRLLTLQTTNRQFLLGTIHASAHAVTGISSVLLLRARKYGRDDVIYIPNGIDLRGINDALARNQRVQGRILFVGRLESMKGVDTLLVAFSELTDTSYSLHIVGDGSEREKLVERAKELRIADRVTFVGQLPPAKVYDEYATAQVFVGLSRSEALGNVFLEAQAAGLGVIASDVGGIPEVVKHDVTGILVAPENPDAAAQAIHALFANPVRFRELTTRAKEHAKGFDWDIIAKRYKTVYDGLL